MSLCIVSVWSLIIGVSFAGGVRVGAQAWLQADCSAGYAVVIADAIVGITD